MRRLLIVVMVALLNGCVGYAHDRGHYYTHDGYYSNSVRHDNGRYSGATHQHNNTQHYRRSDHNRPKAAHPQQRPHVDRNVRSRPASQAERSVHTRSTGHVDRRSRSSEASSGREARRGGGPKRGGGHSR